MIYVLACLAILFLGLVIAWRMMVWMPGRSFRGTHSPLDAREEKIRDVLEQDLTVLGQDIGDRNVSRRYEQLVKAAEFIERSLQESGYETRRQEFTVDEHTVWNIDVERTGGRHPEEIVVVGAHYDTVPVSPGANDNGSAVVANLAVARSFADVVPERTIRFAFFVNEESPYYMTDAMGSLRYAQRCRASDEIVIGMICLETIGCYLEEPGTQRYPVALLRHLYPTTGNFVAVVGNVQSRRLVHRVIRVLRRTKFPSEGMAAPRWMKDIFRSDHAAFWYCGYPALMITDTANFRYRHYHTSEDTPDKINFTALARVVTALKESLVELTG
jgi:Zn-dependent M28 family amino/carboxypeptidase